MTKKYLFILLAFLSFLVLTPAKINAKFRDEDNNQSNLQRNINLDEKPILRKTPPQDATPSGLMSREMNTGKDKQERQENRKEKQANFNEQAQKHSKRLEFRFNKYQALFEKLLNKFKTRIEALKTAGKDTA
ncbi:hypothetical protein GYA19_03050 [Candidatus Beckwithbacteria bacterium]|nr:hypothetical protein [Candidatus Beckwithbacteria bacterium]